MQILGIDTGGSGVKARVIDVDQGTLVGERLRIPTPEPATPKAMQETVTRRVRKFSWQDVVGCGFPGVVRDGRVMTAANIDASWIGTDAATLFADATGCPFHVLNDADATGIAEMRFGAGRERKHLSWSKSGKRFNRPLQWMEELLWPDRFIIGGGASKKFARFFPQIEVKAEIVPAQLRNEAGIIGAALAAAQERESPHFLERA